MNGHGRPPVGVFERAMTLVQMSARLLEVKGQPGAFLQSFDEAPENEGFDAELHFDRLAAVEARARLSARARDGFVGLLGFACLETEHPRLYVEVYDTRGAALELEAAASVAISLGLKRTWTGRYRTVGAATDVEGLPAPLA